MLTTIGESYPLIAIGAAGLFALALGFVSITDRDPAPRGQG